MNRRLAGLLLAIVAATGLLATPAGVAEVRAATPNLTIVTDARYDVQPESHRVRVTVDMVLTNHLADTRTKRFFYDRAVLSVLPGTSGFKLTSSGASGARATVSKTTASYTVLQLALGRKIYSGKTASYRLVFDIVDKGGAATRAIRIGSSLVSFGVWAYATDSTPGSTIRVTFPAGYQVDVQSGDMPSPTTAADGTTTFQTGKLAKPLTFAAYLVADRPASYVDQRRSATVGGTSVDVTIRAWADETAWSDRVAELVTGALPLLSERIGLPWPREGGLTFQETISRTTGGYAGLFDPALGQVEVAYDADDFVVLHESVHSWFNGGLLVDRWANEAFASFYALEIAPLLKVKATTGGLTPELEAARIPLNGWGAIGTANDKTEDYAYAATLTLARAIAKRAGDDGLRAVWADAAGKIGAYQPPPTGNGTADPETVDGPPDWRGLLDLLESKTGVSYEDLWRTWVARPVDLPLLDARADARAKYDATVSAAGDWQLPRAVRDAMRSWQFDQARSMLDAATTVLAKRTQITTGAASSGLTPPPTLRTAFESPDAFATATLEAAGELAAIDRYDAATAARLGWTDLLQQVGLWGTNPAADLERAKTLFGSGDLTGSATASATATVAWSGAEDAGRNRLVSLAGLGLALVFALILLASWWRGRRRRGLVAAPEPYATLAASDDPTEPVEV
ncbi:MAG: hypothetical protein ABJC39_07145, partial [Chloroflexota bacterium]